MYGCYGWRNSSEEYKMRGEKPPTQNNNISIKEKIDDFKLSKLDQDKNSNYFDDFE